jgi:two-component system response regulator ChvI
MIRHCHFISTRPYYFVKQTMHVRAEKINATAARPLQAKKYNIMIVDDEPTITTALQLGLESNGFAVDTFNKPEEALTNHRPRYYDDIILDIKMPTMSGFDLARKIREVDNDVTICFITGFSQYENEALKLFLNLKGCVIKKPFGINDLVSHIKMHLSDQPRFGR